MTEKEVLAKIEGMIYHIRGHRVMLDSDLAVLYGVETKVLNQAVKRNAKRFPDDFMFRLSFQEFTALKSQFVTSKEGRGGKHKLPLVFTENGIAMLSGVLSSDRAISVNIAIMRIFNQLRSYYLMEQSLTDKIGELEINTNKMFKVVFERMDDFEETRPPLLSPTRRKIGFKKGKTK